MPLPGKIAVFGGLEFLGSNVVERLLRRKERVILLEPTGPDIPDEVMPNVEVVRYSMSEGTRADEFIELLEGVHAVVHLSAVSTPIAAQTDLEDFTRKNLLGFLPLLKAFKTRKQTLRRVVVGSSASVYGEGMYYCDKCRTKRYPYYRNWRDMDAGQWTTSCHQCCRLLTSSATPENKDRRPTDPVGNVVRTLEDVSLSYGRNHDVPITALRFFHVYGPGMPLAEESGEVITSSFSCARAGSAPIVYEDGRQTRDFIYVDDAAEAVVFAIYAHNAPFSAFNIGSGVGTPVLDVIGKVSALVGHTGEPEIPGKYRKWDARHIFADITRASQVLTRPDEHGSVSWEPRVSLDEGLKKFVAWASEQPAADTCGVATDALEQDGLIRKIGGK